MPWDAATTKCGLSLIRLGQAGNTAARSGIGTQTERDSKDKVLQLRLMEGNDRKDRVGNGKSVTHAFHPPGPEGTCPG